MTPPKWRIHTKVQAVGPMNEAGRRLLWSDRLLLGGEVMSVGPEWTGAVGDPWPSKDAVSARLYHGSQ